MTPGTRRERRLPPLLATLAALLWAPPQSAAQHPEVLIVVNRESPVSRAIGEYYRRARGVPARNVVELEIPLEDPMLTGSAHETIDRATFEAQVRDPIARFLRRRSLVERIEIIVTTKGVPLRISGQGAPVATWLRDTERAAVDAELALLFSGRDGTPGVVNNVNPYYGADESFAAFRARDPRRPPRYLVARLTGYAEPIDPESGVPADVVHLIDVAQRPAAERGVWLVDEDPRQHGRRSAGNLLLLAPAAAALRALGLAVIHDRYDRFRSGVDDILGYASWGSNDESDPGAPFYGQLGDARYPGRFAPRAVTVDLVSRNGRSFAVATSYGQSLLADLVRLGAGGGAGHAWEPAMPAVARPYIVLRRYAQGVPAAEAFFRSIPYLGWMNYWVGDPLMQVERPVAAEAADVDADGIPNAEDNCVEIPNVRQRDTDGDGYGNLCDADVDGDGVVTTSWGHPAYGDVEQIVRSQMLHRYHPDHDLDGDGAVDGFDVSIAQLNLFLPPGPSGVANQASAAGMRATNEAPSPGRERTSSTPP